MTINRPLPLRRLSFVALLAIALALFLSSGALAQNASVPIIQGLQKDGYYVSPNADALLKSKNMGDANSELRAAVDNLKGRGYKVKIAIIASEDLPVDYNSRQANYAPRYAAYLHDYLNMGNDILVLNDVRGSVGAFTKKLSTSDISNVLNDSSIRAALTSNIIKGTIQYATALQDKIINNDNSSRNTTITLIVIVGVVILIVAAITFINLNKKWQERLATAKQTSSDLSAQVVQIGGNLDFLKLKNARAYEQVNQHLNPGNQLLSDANEKLGGLKRPNPVSLLFQYGKLDDDLRDVEAALASAKGEIDQAQRIFDDNWKGQQ